MRESVHSPVPNPSPQSQSLDNFPCFSQIKVRISIIRLNFPEHPNSCQDDSLSSWTPNLDFVDKKHLDGVNLSDNSSPDDCSTDNSSPNDSTPDDSS